MLQLVEQDESNLLFASDSLKMDKLFVEKVLEKNPKSYQYCSWKFSTDLDFVLEMFEKKIYFIPTYFLRHESDILKILKVYPDCYKYIPLEMKKKKRIITELLNLGANQIFLLPNDLLDDIRFYQEYYSTFRKLYQENSFAFDFIQNQHVKNFRDKNHFLDDFVYPFLQMIISKNVNNSLPVDSAKSKTPVDKIISYDILKEISAFLF